MNKDEQVRLLENQSNYDPVVSMYFAELSVNAAAGGGFEFISAQIECDDEDDVFRPY